MTNTTTDADKYVVNGVEVTADEVIETVTTFLRKQQFRVGRLNARIAELEKDLSNKEIEYTDLWDDALALQSRIAELEAESEQFTVHSHIERKDDNYSNHTQTDAVVYGKWIPVSEGLPEDCERVLVRATNSPHNLPRRAFHTYRNGKWVNDEVDIDNVYSNLNVTHWMPLPTPPEVQE